MGLVFEPIIPKKFKAPVVTRPKQGLRAFYKYDWYFAWMEQFLQDKKNIFLVPCSSTKPIYSSSPHRAIYKKYIQNYGHENTVLVVSEPVVLIYYPHLYSLEKAFLYDFPTKFLSHDARALFVTQLKELLHDKEISGCLPSHHARLINNAVGTNWKNYWHGDLFHMMRVAGTATNQASR